MQGAADRAVFPLLVHRLSDLEGVRVDFHDGLKVWIDLNDQHVIGQRSPAPRRTRRIRSRYKAVSSFDVKDPQVR